MKENQKGGRYGTNLINDIIVEHPDDD